LLWKRLFGSLETCSFVTCPTVATYWCPTAATYCCPLSKDAKHGLFLGQLICCKGTLPPHCPRSKYRSEPASKSPRPQARTDKVHPLPIISLIINGETRMDGWYGIHSWPSLQSPVHEYNVSTYLKKRI
jgi:hypothetical protein